MASIFLSYARQDSAKAGRVASALEAAGHTVWWDKQIGAGSRFSSEIERALEAAEQVIVLWSKASVRSAWVLDEAAAGRDSGRLVPVLLERVEPPLGFRQYQAIDLTGSRRGEAAFQSLVDTVSRSGVRARLDIGQRGPFAWRSIFAAMAAVVLIGTGWWLWSSSRESSGSTMIAVAAADRNGSPQSLDFARSIAIDLGRYRAGPAGMLSIVDGDANTGSKADYRVEVGLSGTGNDLRADVSLQNRKDGRLLWSSAVEGQGRHVVDLRQEVAAEVGDVLRCMAELKASGKPPSAEVESLFLNGCALQEPSEEALSIFRRITRSAPNFGPGWAGLALLESWSISAASEGDRAALIASARAHLHRAKDLAPDFPDTIAAEATLRPGDAKRVRDALAVLDRGIERQPESALLHRLRGEFLLDAGRMRDAVAATRRASELNPLSTAMRDSYISALAYSGRSGEAFEELKRAEYIWSGSSVLRDLRFRLDLRFGDPREALRLLDSNGPVGGSDPAGTAWRSYLEARADPQPAKIEQALAEFRARYDRDPADVPGYLQALGTFGKTDEAYRALQTPEAIDSLFASSHILFRPYMRTIRADPRFIALTAKLGLLAFWRQSGQWPDFCAEPNLPYDCLAEAAKLQTE